MAQATNSTLGEVQLAGDIAGNNNALAPELTATGVTAGSYTIPHLTLDAKGRVTAASNGTSAEITNLVPKASDTVYGIVRIGDNIEWAGSAGYVIIDFNGVLITTSPTGLPNFAGCITVDVTQIINGVSTTRTISISGANAQTASALVTAFNTAASAVGLSVTMTLSGGNLVISSPIGDGNTVTIANDKLFLNCTGYVQVLANAVGTGDGTIWIPVATNSSPGVVKTGFGLTNTNGTISTDAGSISDATDTVKGIAQIGTNIDVAAAVISVKTATSTEKGIASVTVANGLGITDGSIIYTPEVLPDATASVKGIMSVEVANGLSITDGRLAVAAPTVPDATDTVKGVAKIGAGIDVTAGTISATLATTSVKGVVSATNGNGFTLTAGNLSFDPAGLPVGTGSTPGILQVGAGLNISAGTVSVDYTALPVATTGQKGIMQVGAGLSVTTGTVSVDYTALPVATSSVLGLVKVPTANGLSVDGAGMVSIAYATTGTAGVFMVGSTLSISAGTLNVAATVAKTNVVNTFTKAQAVQLVTLTDAATIAVDLSLSNVFKVTLAGNRTVGTPTNPVIGGQYTIVLSQDATGNRVITWPAEFKFRTGQVTTLSTGASKTDVLTLSYVASGVYLADIVKGF